MKTCQLTFLLFALLFAQKVWTAEISINPNPGNFSQNDIFTLDIIGTNFLSVVDGGSVNIGFNPSILQVLSVSIDSVVWNFVNSEGSINNTTGMVSDILVTAFPGVTTSSFMLATVEFQAIGGGSSSLLISESPVNPFASDGSLINPTFTNGTVNVQGFIQPDGDVNGDGEVNAIDVLLATRAALGIIALSPDQLLHGDVAPLLAGMPAPDGKFNTADVLLINRAALGEIFF